MTPKIGRAPTAPSNPANDYVYSPPELEIARDLVRRGLIAAPIILVVSGLIWGVHGIESAGYGLAIVLLNFALAATILAWAARIGPNALMAASFAGFFIRMGLVLVAVLAVQHADWVSLPALLTTILVTHLGLLVWETKYISASLAYPGLKPERKGA
jgi:hypothetical protein